MSEGNDNENENIRIRIQDGNSDGSGDGTVNVIHLDGNNGNNTINGNHNGNNVNHRGIRLVIRRNGNGNGNGITRASIGSLHPPFPSNNGNGNDDGNDADDDESRVRRVRWNENVSDHGSDHQTANLNANANANANTNANTNTNTNTSTSINTNNNERSSDPNVNGNPPQQTQTRQNQRSRSRHRQRQRQRYPGRIQWSRQFILPHLRQNIANHNPTPYAMNAMNMNANGNSGSGGNGNLRNGRSIPPPLLEVPAPTPTPTPTPSPSTSTSTCTSASSRATSTATTTSTSTSTGSIPAFNYEQYDKEIECGICYEIIHNPSHCGSCSARYCRSCLIRALRSQQQSQSQQQSGHGSNGMNGGNGGGGNCPSCRKEMNLGDIQSDPHFFQRSQSQNNENNPKTNTKTNTTSIPIPISIPRNRPCPNVNCMEQIPPHQIRTHDAICPYKPMMCKYRSFGCNWIGPRVNLKDHYKLGCLCLTGGGGGGDGNGRSGSTGGKGATSNTIPILIDEIRQLKWDQERMIDVLNSRLIQERQFTTQRTQQLMVMQRGTLSHGHGGSHGGVDVLDFGTCCRAVYESVCHPRRFLVLAEIWANVFPRGKREVVNNFVCLVPLGVWVLKHSLGGVKYLTKVLDWLCTFSVGVGGVGAGSDASSVKGADMDLFEAYCLELSLSFCILLLGGLFLACFLMDCRCPVGWTRFAIKRGPIDIAHPILRDAAIVTSTFLHFICAEMESHRNTFNFRGLFILSLMQCALFFHPIVQCILTAAAEEPLVGPAASVFRPGRAYGIVQFGIVFGALVVLFDPLSIAHGLWVYSKVADAIAKRVTSKVKHDELYNVLTTIVSDRMCEACILVLLLYEGALLSMATVKDEDQDEVSRQFYSWLFKTARNSTVVFLYIVCGNCVAGWTKDLGEKLGLLMSQSVLDSLQHPFGNPQAFGHYAGGISFFAWVSILCLIAFV